MLPEKHIHKEQNMYGYSNKISFQGVGSNRVNPDTGYEDPRPLHIMIEWNTPKNYIVLKHLMTAHLGDIYRDLKVEHGVNAQFKMIENENNPHVKDKLKEKVENEQAMLKISSFKSILEFSTT